MVEVKNSTDCTPNCGSGTEHLEAALCADETEWNPWGTWRKSSRIMTHERVTSRVAIKN